MGDLLADHSIDRAAGDGDDGDLVFQRHNKNILQRHTYDQPGGHYADHLVPDVMAKDIRGFFRELH